MTQTDCDRIKDYCAKATPGPWTVDSKEPHDIVVWGPPRPEKAEPNHDGSDLVFNLGQCFVQVGAPGTENEEANANFIANARTDLPAAIAEIERLSAENDGHVKEIARLIKVHEPRYHELLSLRAENAHLKSQLEQAKAFRDIGRRLET